MNGSGRRRVRRTLAHRRPLWPWRAQLCMARGATPANAERGASRRPFPNSPTRPARLLQDDLDAAVLRLAHAVRGRDQRPALAHRPLTAISLRGDALADQLGGHRIGAALRELLVVGAGVPERSAWPATSIRVVCTLRRAGRLGDDLPGALGQVVTCPSRRRPGRCGPGPGRRAAATTGAGGGAGV